MYYLIGVSLSLIISSLLVSVYIYKDKIKMYVFSYATSMILEQVGISMMRTPVSKAKMYNRKVLMIEYEYGGELYELLVPYNRRNRKSSNYHIMTDEEEITHYRHNSCIPLFINDRDVSGKIVISDE